mgnify:CR=1 FL=1
MQNQGKIPAHYSYAGVAELADALRSGRSENTLMRVQIPPSALILHFKEAMKSSPLQFNLHKNKGCGKMIL